MSTDVAPLPRREEDRHSLWQQPSGTWRRTRTPSGDPRGGDALRRDELLGGRGRRTTRRRPPRLPRSRTRGRARRRGRTGPATAEGALRGSHESGIVERARSSSGCDAVGQMVRVDGCRTARHARERGGGQHERASLTVAIGPSVAGAEAHAGARSTATASDANDARHPLSDPSKVSDVPCSGRLPRG